MTFELIFKKIIISLTFTYLLKQIDTIEYKIGMEKDSQICIFKLPLKVSRFTTTFKHQHL